MSKQQPDGTHQPSSSEHIYFTDGGCRSPADAVNRNSAWAVIRDVAPSKSEALLSAEEAIQGRVRYPFWRCVGMGHTHGKQTISRAELQAIIFAIENAQCDVAMTHIHIYTDSQYAIDCWHYAGHPFLHHMIHQMENPDLLLQLQQLRLQVTVHFHKVKSHQKYSDLQSAESRWQAFGNNTVDTIVTVALSKLPTIVEDEIRKCKHHREVSTQRQVLILDFMAVCNLERHKLLQTAMSSEVNNRPSSSKDTWLQQAFHFAILRQTDFECPAISDEIAVCNLMGAGLVKAMGHWLQLLIWPEQIQQKTFAICDELHDFAIQGITWLELCFSFFLQTGVYFPVRVSGTGAFSEFVDYNDDAAKLLPKSARSMTRQLLSFHATIRCLESLVGAEFFPKYVYSKTVLLKSLGFAGQSKGIAPRPVLPNPEQTAAAVATYLDLLDGAKSYHLPADALQPHNFFDTTTVEEPNAKERFMNYQRCKRNQRRA
eukprot:Skav228330  [mRNA]  locus=scaffold4117:378510:379964:+ [translate_table: standard]